LDFTPAAIGAAATAWLRSAAATASTISSCCCVQGQHGVDVVLSQLLRLLLLQTASA
jgi:hypothetical protein